MIKTIVKCAYLVAAIASVLNCENTAAIKNQVADSEQVENTSVTRLNLIEYTAEDFLDALVKSYKQNLGLDSETDAKDCLSDPDVRNLSLSDFYTECNDMSKAAIGYAMELSMLKVPGYKVTPFFQLIVQPLQSVIEPAAAAGLMINFIQALKDVHCE